jgi:hypothetical protein
MKLLRAFPVILCKPSNERLVGPEISVSSRYFFSFFLCHGYGCFGSKKEHIMCKLADQNTCQTSCVHNLSRERKL